MSYGEVGHPTSSIEGEREFAGVSRRHFTANNEQLGGKGSKSLITHPTTQFARPCTDTARQR